MKEFRLLVWITQLGLSVAVPPALCTLGAVWLRNRFQLGPWILFPGIGLGFCLAVNGFRASLKAMERMDRLHRETPPVSFQEHQ